MGGGPDPQDPPPPGSAPVVRCYKGPPVVFPVQSEPAYDNDMLKQRPETLE